MKNKRTSIKKVILIGLAGLLGLCLLAVGWSYVVNLNLPTHPVTEDRLSSLDKMRLAEAVHLRQMLGDQIWMGWGSQDIPVILYNDGYAFLIGYPGIPPNGWIKMPQQEQRGGAWELVPGDDFYGEPYYRQPITDPNKTPEAFTVLVGEVWVATLQTKEAMESSFYRDFRDPIPSFLQPIFPYRIFWNLTLGMTETYIEALDHEMFHSFQATTNAQRFSEAELINRVAASYPWEDKEFTSAWESEIDLLLAALRAGTGEEAMQLTGQFWQQREVRRYKFDLTPDQVDYERQREWLEGLAKYSELTLGRRAGQEAGYVPLPETVQDSDFNNYRNQERFWNEQLGEASGSSISAGETRFYYSGLVEAALLDRLMPGWKERILVSDLALEDLLRELTPVK